MFRPHIFISRGDAILALVKCVLLGTGIFLTTHLFPSRIDDFWLNRAWFSLFAFTGIWLAAAVSMMYLAFLPRNLAKAAWTIVLALATIAGDAYFSIAHDPLTPGMIEAMLDAPLPGAEFYAFYRPFFLSSVLATTITVAGIYLPPYFKSLAFRWGPAIPAAPLLMLIIVTALFAGHGGSEFRGMPIQYQSLAAIGVYAASQRNHPPKADVTLRRIGPPAAQNIVVIIDESISGDFIDLNVQRGTTPFLRGMSKDIANFGLATSFSSCILYSNAVIRLGVNPKRLAAGQSTIFRNPSVWKYARQAGYETNHIDFQELVREYRFIAGAEEFDLIDRHFDPPGQGQAYLWDQSAIQLLVEILDNPEPQFVIFNKVGAHFPYQSAHPPDETPFMPAMQAGEPINDRGRLINSYKNAIRWSVDRFFEALLAQIKLEETLVIYTSDHGQNLMDDGTHLTHCRARLAHLNE